MMPAPAGRAHSDGAGAAAAERPGRGGRADPGRRSRDAARGRARHAARRLLRADDPRPGARLPCRRARRARRLRDEGVRERRPAAAARRRGPRGGRLHARRARLRACGRRPRRAHRLPRQQQVRPGAGGSRPGGRPRRPRRAGEAEAAAEAGVRRVLVRLTPGVEAVTHRAIRTAHAESKFGLAPPAAEREVERARELGLEVEGLHVHVGSQLSRVEESLRALEDVLAFGERLGWTPRLLDLGGGLGIRHNRAEVVPSVAEFVRPLVERVPPGVGLILEPGRSLVGRAGVTLYRVGSIKASGGVTYAAIDGGMSDNPRPQLYGARYEALLANRASEPATGVYRVAGKHCESGDVLIEAAELPQPRPGDVLAVPATGAYTLALGSTYNGVPRPAAVLVADGAARLIRRRETVADLLRFEV